MGKKRVLVFSGGTGSKNLQRAFYTYIGCVEDTYLLNLYDDGLSTGDCRNRFQIPGPSDLRKVQNFQHFLRYGNTTKFNLLEKRLTGTATELEKCLKKTICTLKSNKIILKAIDTFFVQWGPNNLLNFSLGNIIYAGLFLMNESDINKSAGAMAEFLKIPIGKVVINTNQSLYLKGRTVAGSKITTEHELDISDPKDRISDVWSEDILGNQIDYSPNKLMLEHASMADLIIYSSGNYWTSIIPTLLNKELRSIIEKKVGLLLLNLEEPSDMRGMEGFEMQETMYRFLPNSTVTLIDSNRITTVQKDLFKFPVRRVRLSKDTNGEHDPALLSNAIENYL